MQHASLALEKRLGKIITRHDGKNKQHSEKAKDIYHLSVGI